MPGSARCGGCGADLPYAASFCPRCGRSAAEPLRELELIGGPAAPLGGPPSTVAEPSGPRNRRGLAALAALAVVLVATVLLLADGGSKDGFSDDGREDVAAPTTTRPGTPNTKLNYPEPTRPGETTSTRPPTTTAVPTTTSTTTTQVAYLSDGPAPVLGEDTGGLSVYAYEKTAIRRLELDTGRITTMRLPTDFGDYYYLLSLRGDRLVLTNGSVERTVARDLSGAVSEPSNFGPGNLVPGTDIRWSQQYEPGKNAVVLQRPGHDDVHLDLPVGFTLQGVLSDRILITGGGRIFTVDLSGRLRDYAAGTLVSGYGQWVLWWGCDSRAQCRYHLGDSTHPDVHDVRATGALDPYAMSGIGAALVAPDGVHAILPGSDGVPALVDLRTGAVVQEVAGGWNGSFVWSPDSRWLFQYSGPGAIQAVSTTDGHVVELLGQMPGTTSGPSGLAVG